MTETLRVAALYRFVPFASPGAIRAGLLDALAPLDLCGTLLLAPEGINGTIAGPPEAIDAALDVLRALPGCAGLDVKLSTASAPPFRRFRIRLKREIVSMGVADADPNVRVGTHVAPEAWNALITDPDTWVIDTRNDYEVGIGSFDGAINPGTLTFREFPDWFRARIAGAPPKRVAMFCTGGIRCEKATSFVRSLGIEPVYHLRGGILAYLETIPETDSLWRGECFVFDERVAVGHGLREGEAVLCRACKYPVMPDAFAHPDYEPGVSCPRCRHTTSDAQKARFRERQRQLRLERARREARGAREDAGAAACPPLRRDRPSGAG